MEIRRAIPDSTRVRENKARPIQKNLDTLTCSLEDCHVEVQVHKKQHAILANCGRSDCPNGKKDDGN